MIKEPWCHMRGQPRKGGSRGGEPMLSSPAASARWWNFGIEGSHHHTHPCAKCQTWWTRGALWSSPPRRSEIPSASWSRLTTYRFQIKVTETVACAEPGPVIEYVAPTTTASCAAPAPLIEYMAIRRLLQCVNAWLRHVPSPLRHQLQGSSFGVRACRHQYGACSSA